MKVALARTSLLSLDPVVDNPSWHWVFSSDTATDFTNFGGVMTQLTRFVNVPGTGGASPIAHYLSQVISAGASSITHEIYDITAHLDGSPHGSPVLVHEDTSVVTGAAAGLPEGVAATISYRADYGTDVEFGPGTRPRARDRNRLYVGPLNTSVIAYDTTTNRCKFKAQFITDCLASLFDMSEDITTGPDTWVLKVWSRKNAALKLPTVGWMDDRPDYQRRRADPSPGTRVFRDLASV